ncbi:hypothetical protein GCM10027569_71820 [Flindersiella endophytica]
MMLSGSHEPIAVMASAAFSMGALDMVVSPFTGWGFLLGRCFGVPGFISGSGLRPEGLAFVAGEDCSGGRRRKTRQNAARDVRATQARTRECRGLALRVRLRAGLRVGVVGCRPAGGLGVRPPNIRPAARRAAAT